jgi:hypothetical protein
MARRLLRRPLGHAPLGSVWFRNPHALKIVIVIVLS